MNTPWFEAWRDLFLKLAYPGDHEFLKHYMACIYVVSTSHLDPLDQYHKLMLQHQQLHQQQHHQHQHQQMPGVVAGVAAGVAGTGRPAKWLFPNIGNTYKYFVLLHDVQEGELSK